MKNETIKLIKEYYCKDNFIKDPTGYFYDLDIIGNNINLLSKNMPKQISLYYAIKANSNNKIVDFITKSNYVKGIEIASYGELEYSKKYIGTDNIIFTGPGKTIYELEEAIKNKIRFINVESIVELYKIQEIADKLNVDSVDVLLRFNLNYSLNDGVEKMAGCSTKLGIDEYIADLAFSEARKLKRVNVKGIHAFIASGVLDYEALIRSNNYVFNFVKNLEKKYGKFEVIDFGGGLGIDYSNEGKIFDIEKYGISLKKLIKDYDFIDKEIIMELGTYLVGNGGYYTSKIMDIKENKGHKHIIIAGGVNHMGLPLEMRRKQPVRIIKMNDKKYFDKQCFIHNEIVDISGPICMSNDKLSWDEFIEEANVGDIVVYLQSGAYCYGEGMQKFLMHFEPKEIVFGGKNGD